MHTREEQAIESNGDEVQGEGKYIADLPNEILHMITEYVSDLSDLCNLRLTDQRFKDIIDSVIVLLQRIILYSVKLIF